MALEKLSFLLNLLLNQVFNRIFLSLSTQIELLQSLKHPFAALLMLIATILKLPVYFGDGIVTQEIFVAFDLLK